MSKQHFGFPDVSLKPGPVADVLRPYGIGTLYNAVNWVWKLPYERNSDRADYMLVTKEPL
jgi:hypothetical protein